MHLQAIVAICLSIVQPLLCYDGAKGTLGNPILEYLKMDPKKVEYEVVPVLHAIQDRSPENPEPTQIHFKAFGKDYKLSLKPTEDLFKSDKHVPMWTVARNESNPDDFHYEEIAEASTDVGDIYQDPVTMSSVLLHHDNAGQVQVEGHIGSDLIIRSLPVRVLRQVVDETKGLDDQNLLPNVTSRERRSLRLTNHHVVIKRSSQSTDEEHSDFMLMEADHLSERFTTKRSAGARSKRSAPSVIYPEILCIVDYDTYRSHNGDKVEIKRYFMTFWNAVDLRYKLLKNPEIKLSIAGIIIASRGDATPYLGSNRVGGDALDAAGTLTDMGKYLYREKQLPVYDMAVVITKLDLCHTDPRSRVCNRGTAGYASVGGACVTDEYHQKFNGVGVIEDNGGFGGIIVAAHEVGHLLGVSHDGSSPPGYLGGPGGRSCRWNDGYIMSDLRHTENGVKWSPCSVASFRHFINGKTAECLYNVPRGNEKLPDVLPGKLLSLDEQCEKAEGTKACFKDDRVCTQLFCFQGNSNGCISYRPAAEGSPCGDGKYCINGRCVAEHGRTIPNGGQNIPPYIHWNSVYNNGPRNWPPTPHWGKK